MIHPDPTTPAALAAIAFEGALLLGGLWLIWRLVARPAARASRQVRLPEWRLAPVDFACFLCFGFVGAMALSAVAGLVFRHVRLASDAATVVGSAMMEGGFLLGIAGFYAMYGARARGAAAAPALLPALKSGLATFLIVIPVVDTLSFVWGYAIDRMGLPDEKQEMLGLFENMHSAALRWLFVALAAVLVPAAEEILFRGGLFRYFRTRAPRWAALWLTSALFGALHVAWGHPVVGLQSLLPLTALAAIFCLAYERTGLVGTTIVAHALFNLNTMFLVLTGIGS